MDILELIGEAEVAGLKIAVDGERLRVQGPRDAEAIVRRLSERKREVIAILRQEKEGMCCVEEAKTLVEYCDMLRAWHPKDGHDLPPVPPFSERPERPVAWAAWWASVGHRNRMVNP